MNSDEEYLDRLLRSVSEEDKTRGKSSMASEQEKSNNNNTTISGDENNGDSSVVSNNPMEVKKGNSYSNDELAEMLEHLNLDENPSENLDENQGNNNDEDYFSKDADASDISDFTIENPNETNELEDIFAMNDNNEETDFSADTSKNSFKIPDRDDNISNSDDMLKTERDLETEAESELETEAESEFETEAESEFESAFESESEFETGNINTENPEELENDELLNLLKTLNTGNDNDTDSEEDDLTITDDMDDSENGEIEVNLSDIADKEKALGIKEKKSRINDDEDVTLLLDTIPEDDELAEINNLLKKTDNQEFVEDDMLSLLENMPKENDDTKKNSKAAGKGSEDAFDFFSNDDAEGDSSEEDEEIAKLLRTGNAVVDAANRKNSKAEKTEKNAGKKVVKVKPEKKAKNENAGEKVGFFKKLFALLTAVDEDEEETAAASGDEGELDENNKILQELDKADKAKKGKGKSSKKTKPNDDNEETDEKGKKGKSAKKTKEKAPKKEKVKKAKPAAIEESGPKLKKKAVVLIAILTITIFIAIMLVSTYIPSIIEKNAAHTAFDNQDYESTFYLLTGEKMDEKDAVIYRKSTLILGLQREYDSYNNYITIGDPLKALNALMGGIETYQFNYNEAVQLGIETAYNEKYNNLLSLLAIYNLTEEDALTINALDNKTYSLCLEEIVEGRDYKTVLQPETTTTTTDNTTDTTTFTDVLPEEQSTANDLLNTINN